MPLRGSPVRHSTGGGYPPARSGAMRASNVTVDANFGTAQAAETLFRLGRSGAHAPVHSAGARSAIVISYGQGLHVVQPRVNANSGGSPARHRRRLLRRSARIALVISAPVMVLCLSSAFAATVMSSQK